MLKIMNNDNTLDKVRRIKKVRYLTKDFIVKLEKFFSDNFIFSVFNQDIIKSKLTDFLTTELPDIVFRITINDYYSTPNPSVIINIDEFDFEIKIDL